MSTEDIKKLGEDVGKAVADARKYAEEVEAKGATERTALQAEIQEKLDNRANELEAKAAEVLKRAEDAEKKAAEVENALSRINQGNPHFDRGEAAEYKAAIADCLRTGAPLDLSQFKGVRVDPDCKGQFQLDLKLLATDSHPDGGFAVSVDNTGRMVRTERETSPIMQYATVETTSKPIKEGVYDDGDAAVVKRGERELYSQTDTPQGGTWRIDVNDYVASPAITRNMRSDADLDIVGWLQQKVDRDIMLAVNFDAVNGTGVKELRGFTTYPAGTNRGQIQQLTTASAGVIETDDVLKLKDLTKVQYDANARFFMHKRTAGVLRRLKDNEGQYLWSNNLVAGQPPTFDGTEVIYFQDMVTPNVSDQYNTGELPIAYGDMARCYEVVDRAILDVVIDEVTRTPEIIYHTIRRIGGDVVNFEALKLLAIQ